MDCKKQQELTIKHKLKPCSMGRCCNAERIEKLTSSLQKIADFSIKDKRSTDDSEMIKIAMEALDENNSY